MKVIVLGGTGLIGYHVILNLLSNNYEVSMVSRGSIDLEDLFPGTVSTTTEDVFQLAPPALANLFSDSEAMIYALGPDDRDLPLAPAYDYFHEYLVVKCKQICESAKTAGVKKIIILSSYFSYFDRVHPEWSLAQNHPYIKCRREQTEACLQLADENFEVIILELPYVFGVIPKRDPLWKDLLVSRLNKMKPWIFYTSGGTAMISVKLAADAIRGAIKYGSSGIYTVGDVNMSWKEMLAIATKALYGKERKVLTVPTIIAQLYGKYEKSLVQKTGKETGLDYSKIIVDIQSKYTYIPEEVIVATTNDLHLSRGGVKRAIQETFKRCRD